MKVESVHSIRSKDSMKRKKQFASKRRYSIMYNLQSQINTLNYFKSLHTDIKTRGYKRRMTYHPKMKAKKKTIFSLKNVQLAEKNKDIFDVEDESEEDDYDIE